MAISESLPCISVIIPVFQDPDGLVQTFESLCRQSLSKDSFEIIVANDGGNHSIRKLCEKFGARFIDIVPNKGSYNARNEGIKTSRADWLAFLDAGIVVQGDWLANGLRHLRAYDYVAGDVKISSKQFSSIAEFHDATFAFPMRHYFEADGFGGAGNLFVRRSVFQAIGPFDARLQSGGDFEFGRRVVEARSLKRFFAEDCQAFHPPRSHKEKVSKIKRISNGHRRLIELYGERFSFLKPQRSVWEKAKSFLPPTIQTVNRYYKPHPQFKWWQFYFYMYRIKIIEAWYDL